MGGEGKGEQGPSGFRFGCYAQNPDPAHSPNLSFVALPLPSSPIMHGDVSLTLPSSHVHVPLVRMHDVSLQPSKICMAVGKLKKVVGSC